MLVFGESLLLEVVVLVFGESLCRGYFCEMLLCWFLVRAFAKRLLPGILWLEVFDESLLLEPFVRAFAKRFLPGILCVLDKLCPR